MAGEAQEETTRCGLIGYEMNTNGKSIFSMRFFEEIAQKKTIVHSIHPLVKLLVTLFYIVVVISGDKYSLVKLMPLAVYPFVIIPLAEIPLGPILKRTLIVMPFVVGIGIFNPIFDTNVVTIVSGIEVSAGWISFFTLLYKSVLTVFAALLLFATTGIERIGYALRLLRVPKLFVLQILLTFRYITLFTTTISRTASAYSLRAPEHKGIRMKAWGPLAGQLLMRSFDTAQKVYDAMVLRGFEGEYHPGGRTVPRTRDFVYAGICCLFFSVVLVFDIPQAIGTIVPGGFY